MNKKFSKKKLFFLYLVIFSFIFFYCCFSQNLLSSPGENTLKIGAIFALTGKSSKGRIESVNGIKLAIDEINQKGGILGKKVELKIYDNKSSPIYAQYAAKKAVNDGVYAVIGCTFSSYSIAAAKILQKNKTIMISNLSTNVELTKIGNYIFRVCFSDDFQGKALAKFAFKNIKSKKTAILVDIDQVYSIGLAKYFKNVLLKFGGNVVYEGRYSETQISFQEIIDNLKKVNPDLIFIPGYPRASGFIVKAIRKSNINAILLGGDAWYKLIIDYADGFLTDSFSVSHWNRNLKLQKNINFIKNYEKRFGQIFSDSPALAYDAVYILKNAIEKAKSFDKAKVRNALENIKSFEGVTGEISFNKERNPIKPLYIIKYENNDAVYYKTIYPDKYEEKK